MNKITFSKLKSFTFENAASKLKNFQFQKQNISSKLKTLFLCFLILTSILLSSELWLTSGHSFFVANSPLESEDFESYFFMPRRILTSPRGNRFVPTYLTSPDYQINNIIKNRLGGRPPVISTTLHQLNYNTLNFRGIFYDYSFPIPSYLFEKYFGATQLPYVTGILVSPSEQNFNVVYIELFDSVNNFTERAQLVNSEYHNILMNRIAEANARLTTQNFYYSSSFLMGFNLPRNNFLARWQESELVSQNISPLKFSEVVTIFEAASVFFLNPSEVWISYEDGIYRFAGENSVVTFGDRLTYTNYRPNRIISEANVLINFNAAKNFMNAENINISPSVGGITLSNFAYSENITTFYFDYLINNFPVYLGEPFAEIKVDSGVVVSYKRMMPFILTDETANISKDAIDFINIVGSENNVSFGYLKNNLNTREEQTLSLGWRVILK
ncbi:MAG: hypothetical protein FWF50_05730 [Defluviitaleaceae bacterium]|nr:hypothetical protein [Defluviitaleaceae bacterium]